MSPPPSSELFPAYRWSWGSNHRPPGVYSLMLKQLGYGTNNFRIQVGYIVRLAFRCNIQVTSEFGIPFSESRRFSVNSWVLGGAIFALLAVVALVIVSVHVRCHCTPISDVGSCRASPGRPELTRQRSHPAQQPVYAGRRLWERQSML